MLLRRTGLQAGDGAAASADLVAVEKESSLAELAIELGLVASQGGTDLSPEPDVSAVATEG